MRHSWWKVLVVAISLTGLVNCAHVPGRQNRVSLRGRVELVWQAKVDKQWDKVYDNSCREWKKKVTKNAFLRRANLVVTSYRIIDIEVEPDKKEATVTVMFDANPMGFSFKGIKVKERWVYENNNWYFCPRVGGAKSLFEKKKK